jgi:hypothetical protein
MYAILLALKLLLPYDAGRAAADVTAKMCDEITCRHAKCGAERGLLQKAIRNGQTKMPDGTEAKDALAGLQSLEEELGAERKLLGRVSGELNRLFPQRPPGEGN